jgi:hypothetical protein
VARVAVASMEQRPGAEYAFAGPMLESLLGETPFAEGDVVLARLFVSPGRHAGLGGDLDEICSEAMRTYPGLRVHPTELLGTDPRLAEILAERYREAWVRAESGR